MNYNSLLQNYRGTIYDLDSRFSADKTKLQSLIEENVGLLETAGVSKLQRVALVVNSSFQFIVHYFALIKTGAVPVLMSKYSTRFELEKCDEHYGIHWILTDNFALEKLVSFEVDKIHTISFNNDIYKYNLICLNEDAPLFTSLEGMILQPTSGSTGEVKFCVRDEYGCLAEPINHMETTGFKNGHIFCPLPLNHAYGFGTAFLLAFVTSSDLTLLNEFNPRKVLRVFEEYDINMFTGTSAVYDIIRKMKIDDPSILPEYLVSAGAPLAEDVAVEYFERFHRTIYPSYGSTETGEMCLERESIISPNGSTGTPLRQTKLRIEAVNETCGQIWVKNPSIMVGYLKRDGSVDNGLIREDGYFPTGDLGYFNENGRLVLNGRLKRMINVFGIKVNPTEVEEALFEIKGIKDAYVYAGKHRSGSDIVVAEVACDLELTELEIIRECKKRLTTQKVPSKIFKVDKIPRNSSGKIILSELIQA